MYEPIDTRKGIGHKLHNLARANTKTAQALKAIDTLAPHMGAAAEADLMHGAQTNLRMTIAWLTYCDEYLTWLHSTDLDGLKKPKEPQYSLWRLTY